MKIGILGYGNLGRGVEAAIKKNPDMDLVAIFTRRNPSDLKINSNASVVSTNEIESWKNKIDVLILTPEVLLYKFPKKIDEKNIYMYIYAMRKAGTNRNRTQQPDLLPWRWTRLLPPAWGSPNYLL